MGNQQVVDLSTFKTIPFARNYMVNEYGDIYSKTSNKILKQVIRPDGYRRLKLRNNGVVRAYLVHRIVAEVFLPNENNYRVVNHKNGVKHDNHVSNLEWVSHSGNAIHAFDTGLKSNYGENNPRHVLNERDVINIYNRLFLGASVTAIAREYSVEESAIGKIKTKSNWYDTLKDMPDIPMRYKAKALTEEDFDYLVSLRNSGKTARQISEIMGISIPQVESNIRKMRSKSSTTISQESRVKWLETVETVLHLEAVKI